MNKPISALMTTVVVSVDTEDTVERIEQVMNSRNHTSVPVCDKSGEVFGIISLKDLEHFRFAKKNPKVTRAWEICTYKPIQVEPNTSVDDVGRLMVKNQIHHVLVTEHGVTQGIVSSLDLLRGYIPD